MKRYALSGLTVLLFFLASGQLLAATAETVQIQVSGIQGPLLNNAQAALSIPPGLVVDGKVNLPWLNLFQSQIPEKVQRALEAYGYYNARVTTERKPVGDGGYALMVHVDAGPPVTVTEVNVSLRGPGAQEEELRDLVGAFPLQKGALLKQEAYENAKGTMEARALELGYLDAKFSTHRILVSKSESTARIELVMETGPRYLFGTASFAGGETYPESFIRRYLAFKKGDFFSNAKISATQLNLVNSERFRDVIIIPHKEQAQDLYIPLEVKLEPSLPQRLRFGAGYGTDTGFRVSTTYKHMNFLNWGHEVNGELNISEFIQGLMINYLIPGSDMTSTTGIQLKVSQEDISTYESQRTSLELNRTKGLFYGLLGTAYVRVEREESTIGGSEVNARMVLPGVRITRQRYDDPIRPSRGHRFGLELRGTDRFLGSDVGLIQTLGDGKMVLPLPARLSLISRFQAAATVEKYTINSLPASLRFFTGGDNSVRGYAYQSLGPEDEIGTVIGGRNLLVGSVELERAIGMNWGLAVFTDAGNAFSSYNEIRLFQSAGLGVRYYTPVGPIRFDVARQIGVEDPGFRIHFSFGFQL